MSTFSQFQLSSELQQAVSNMGFEEATPIQAKAIPIALTGKDVIGQAQTGTGKTTAFGLPMIEKVDRHDRSIQGIVLAPTRELAIQVAEELNRLGQVKGIRTLPIYGGQEISRQIRALKNKPQLIAATPGRLLDHISRRTIRLNQIQTVVLDEADEMLNMGFIEDIEKILDSIHSEYQTLLFSATMPERIRTLANKFMNDPEIVRVKAKTMTVSNIDQTYIEVREKQKFDVFCSLLDIQSPELAIVFGRTKKRVDELVEGLIKRGYSAEGIHGDLTQKKRDQVIRMFKQQRIDIMVATDVAARGLDISGVSHVYNFDIPQDPESYVHRIGRTGRAGKTGIAVTLVTPRELDHLKTIEQVTRKTIVRKPIPTIEDVVFGNKKATIQQIMNTIDEGDFQAYKKSAENLLEDIDSVTLLSACLKIMTKEPDHTPVVLTEVPPLHVKKKKRFSGGQGRRKDSRNNQKRYDDKPKYGNRKRSNRRRKNG
ncbi:ATP-dependent RNA helicase DeaD [Oikeobacillus pervagus]|uniref:ATP-dependent RNA helicase CshA n=1 Tax=Oikeobacillus pervagus TaxID=1325931 RepID=A0AAJ1WGV1_9BACI|nr:DEAD/DEAH box helicase [Oikeobacillus pervagus]MDQ0215507.1 ATP-dependent RNA helicase DeaD [Oikeobacillus pervagus]